MHFVYILELKNGRYYSGYSSNIEKRITEHKKGLVKVAKDLIPVGLVHYAAFD